MARRERTRAGSLAFASLVALAVSLSSGCAPVPRELDQGGPLEIVADGVAVSLGPRVKLLPSGSLDLTYFPDQGVVTLETEPTLRLVVVSAISSWLVEGEDITHLSRARELDRYVMILHLHFWKETPRSTVPPTLPGHNSGIYIAFSRDGIAWGSPTGSSATARSPSSGAPSHGRAESSSTRGAPARAGWCTATASAGATGPWRSLRAFPTTWSVAALSCAPGVSDSPSGSLG
ncbi:MAG: hypothetical protein CL908_13645 [Deltaproteobacteria bacterium]|jgi:hypothetical protein|nr:hypothetical protein [Deltaproteobacteria bacterium]